MSFTIKCDKCGNSQKFINNDYRRQDNIELEVGQRGYENMVDRITVYCENEKCNHYIDIDY